MAYNWEGYKNQHQNNTKHQNELLGGIISGPWYIRKEDLTGMEHVAKEVTFQEATKEESFKMRNHPAAG